MPVLNTFRTENTTVFTGAQIVAAPPKQEAKSVLTAAKPFLTGSIAGCFSTCCIQPMDMIKVRIQLNAASGAAASPVGIASKMIAEEGVASLYAGLSAGLTRQVVYTGSRLGLYDVFTDKAKEANGGKPLPLHQTALCALAAGGIAAVVGNPADLSLVRMQADSMLPPAERRGYSSVVSALLSIVKHEGPLGLLKGAGPTATRAMGLNLGMLGGNTEAKKHLKQAGLEGNALIFSASAIAGFFASFFSLPFDFVKTMMQKQKPDPVTGELQFKSSIDCAMKTMAEGGPLRFYAGFPTFYVRIAPHAMITLIAQDSIKKFWASIGM